MLANIYLNILDRIWERHDLAKTQKARLVRYADDMVIMCKGDPTPTYTTVERILEKLELTLNKEKTQIKDSRKETFGFLGFDVGMSRSIHTGKHFPKVEPSAKSLQRIKEKIKQFTQRTMSPVPIDYLVNKLNQTVRGWSQYFHYGHGHQKMKKIKYYLEERLRLHLGYRHKLKNHGAAYT